MNNNRLRIFVSTYACKPGSGSEPGVGWHWTLEMSKYFDLWVLTRESNRHNIELWIAAHPEYSAIHFLYFDLPKWARFWKKGMRWERTYYNIWQYCTNSLVKRTMQKNDIHIFHHLTFGNALWKVNSYGQKQFFIWGPVGGLETIPKEYSCHYDKKSRLIEKIRTAIVYIVKYSYGFRQHCKNANMILCKTDITRSRIPEKFAAKAILFTDVAVNHISAMTSSPKEKEITQFITVGRLDAWRGFDLIVEAVANAVKTSSNIHLTIVGEGRDKERIERLIRQNRLETVVTLTGYVPIETYKNLMNDADAVINASLKEGAVTVSFDSMAIGKPLICLDTTGYTRYFTKDYSILIPRTSRKEVIESIKKGILELTDYKKRQMLSRKARDAASKFSWENRGIEIRDTILKAYTSYFSQ